MTDFDEQMRRTVRAIADAGQPVNMGQRALDGAARRRRRTAIAVAALAVLAVVIPVAAVRAGRSAGPPAGGPRAGHVITAYATADDVWQVLDPQTGEYRSRLDYGYQPAVSPDLRFALNNANMSIVLASTVDNDVRRVASPPGRWFVGAAWSPDSGQVAAMSIVSPVDSAGVFPPNAPMEQDVTEMAIVQRDTGDLRRVPLAFPTGRAGIWPSSRMFWLDAGHLAVPSAALADPVGARIIDRVSVFDLDGRLTMELPIDQTPGSPGDRWSPTGLTQNGKALLVRRADANGMELAFVDLATDRGPYRVVTFRPPAAEAGQQWLSNTAGWLGADQVLIAVTLVSTPGQDGAVRPLPAPDRYAVLDLVTGEARPAELPAPPNAKRVMIGEAQGLGPLAARLVF